MVFPPHSTELLHLLLRREISQGDLVIDATAGNGHDTCFLAELVGAEGHVIAFDIQASAIEATRQKLQNQNLLDQVSLHQISHTELLTFASPQSVKAVVFNLGYLPGANRKLATDAAETIPALSAAVEVLKPGGILAVTCYPGHPQGASEATAVETFFHDLPDHRVARYSLVATKNPAPFLLLARNGRKNCLNN